MSHASERIPKKKGFWRNPTKKTWALFSAYRTEEGLEHTRLHLGWLPAWGEICQRIHFSLDFTQTKRNLVVFCESSCWFLWDTYCNFWKRMTVHFFQTLKLTVRTPAPPPKKKQNRKWRVFQQFAGAFTDQLWSYNLYKWSKIIRQLWFNHPIYLNPPSGWWNFCHQKNPSKQKQIFFRPEIWYPNGRRG